MLGGISQTPNRKCKSVVYLVANGEVGLKSLNSQKILKNVNRETVFEKAYSIIEEQRFSDNMICRATIISSTHRVSLLPHGNTLMNVNLFVLDSRSRVV